MTDSAETMREAIARIIDPRAFDNPKYPASDDTMWREAARDTALTRAAAILAMQAERRGSDPLAAPIKTAPIAGLEPVAWQSRQRFNLERMAMGNIGGWSQCSSDEAMDHWARRPDFEYRGLFTRAQLEAHAAEQVRAERERIAAWHDEQARKWNTSKGTERNAEALWHEQSADAIRARGQV